MHSVPRVGGGFKPRKYLDHRNYSYGHTFGTTEAFLTELNFDARLTVPDQNKPDPRFNNPAFPNGCTAFTTTDIATDEDKNVYNPAFTYARTLLLEDAVSGSPCSIQDSLKSSMVYGLAQKDEGDAEALHHRRGPYFEIRPTNGQDWFDAIRSSVQKNKRSVSVGTQWFPEFTTASGGIVDSFSLRNTNDWHDFKVSGWKPVGNKQYLIVKPWVGPDLGDKGFFYFSRETVNKLFSVKGCGVFTNAHALPSDIQSVQLTLLQTLVSYYYRLLDLIHGQPA